MVQGSRSWSERTAIRGEVASIRYVRVEGRGFVVRKHNRSTETNADLGCCVCVCALFFCCFFSVTSTYLPHAKYVHHLHCRQVKWAATPTPYSHHRTSCEHCLSRLCLSSFLYSLVCCGGRPDPLSTLAQPASSASGTPSVLLIRPVAARSIARTSGQINCCDFFVFFPRSRLFV